MGLVKDLVDKTIAQLTAITDAGYQGDPSGTDANNAYFEGNVHNYLKAVGVALSPSKEYFVSPAFSGLTEVYYLPTLAAAHAQIVTDGSGSSNKALVTLGANASSYSDALTLNHNGYVVVKGKSRNNCVISGNITISTGTYIFDQVRFENDITVSGGKAIFLNCTKPSGAFTQSGSASTVIISECDRWSYVVVTGNDKIIHIRNIKDMTANAGISINLAISMTGGTYIFTDSYLQGTIDEKTAATNISNVQESYTALPAY